MGKPRMNDTPVEKGTHGLSAAFIASAYFSIRPYLEAQVVYMKPMTPRTLLPLSDLHL